MPADTCVQTTTKYICVCFAFLTNISAKMDLEVSK